MLLNILDNAIKYTEEGSVTPSVMGEECTDDMVTLKIKVADTGIGIREENLEGIYDAFNRYDEAHNKRILGTGLGLAITKQLVDMMDGEILVDSIYRKGTIFTIVLKQKIVDRRPFGNIVYQDRMQETQKEYLKRVPFEKVITNKTSFTTACSVGMGTVGFAYYTQPK